MKMHGIPSQHSAYEVFIIEPFLRQNHKKKVPMRIKGPAIVVPNTMNSLSSPSLTKTIDRIDIAPSSPILLPIVIKTHFLVTGFLKICLTAPQTLPIVMALESFSTRSLANMNTSQLLTRMYARKKYIHGTVPHTTSSFSFPSHCRQNSAEFSKVKMSKETQLPTAIAI
jgi:hypothetical protein